MGGGGFSRGSVNRGQCFVVAPIGGSSDDNSVLPLTQLHSAQ